MVQDQEIWPVGLWYHDDQSNDLERLGLSGFSHVHQNAQDSRFDGTRPFDLHVQLHA
jgi:hypothetical protein